MENSIESLNAQISENDNTIVSLEEKIFNLENENDKVVEEHLQTQEKLKEEIHYMK